VAEAPDQSFACAPHDRPEHPEGMNSSAVVQSATTVRRPARRASQRKLETQGEPQEEERCDARHPRDAGLYLSVLTHGNSR